jgi:hypothetical protein
MPEHLAELEILEEIAWIGFHAPQRPIVCGQ